MSLILEALKKSETRRRLGEAPDIGTPFTVKPRRRNPWPLIVILVAAAAGTGWWYMRTMPRPGDANTIAALPSPPAAPAAGKGSASAQPTVAKAAPSGPARDTTSVQAQPKPEAASATGAKPSARADGSAVGATAPGAAPDLQTMRPMNRHLPTPTVPVPATANQKPFVTSAPTAPAPASRATPPPGTTAVAPARPATGPTVAAPPAPAPANIAKAEPGPGAAKPIEAPPAAAPAAPSAPAAPAVPQYYELAYGVRKDIPQFNLSMHVFAADAAARFVVTDGERKAEGDTVKEGLILREIRPDGVVLEFRGQRFFYPRPGH